MPKGKRKRKSQDRDIEQELKRLREDETDHIAELGRGRLSFDEITAFKKKHDIKEHDIDDESDMEDFIIQSSDEEFDDEEELELSDLESVASASKIEQAKAITFSKSHGHLPEGYENSVVKIYNNFSEFDFDRPWNSKLMSTCKGSGFILEYQGQKFIMTNSHVASQNDILQLKFAFSPEKYKAEILLEDLDCDLAILKVTTDTSDFWKQAKPLPLGKFVDLQQKLVVCGYPRGGSEICITSGKVSRIEHDRYVQGNAELPSVQVSAHINPGNSGGPVISAGSVVGVAFQGIGQGGGLGYMIPTSVIRHFLNDYLKNGVKNYQGFPDLAIHTQELESVHLKQHYGLKKSDTGVLISSIDHMSPAKHVLKKGDVITKIDGININDDGTYKSQEYSSLKRINYRSLFSCKYLGDTVTFDVMRDKKRMSLDVVLQNRAGLTKRVEPYNHNRVPSFYIASGIVFRPLNGNLIDDSSIDFFPDAGEVGLLVNRYRSKKKLHSQVVFIQKVIHLTHNLGYQHVHNAQVKKVNGHEINNMRELVVALRSNKDDSHIIETTSKELIVVPRLSDKENKKSLERHGILKFCSDDLTMAAIKKPIQYAPGCPEYWYKDEKDSKQKESTKSRAKVKLKG